MVHKVFMLIHFVCQKYSWEREGIVDRHLKESFDAKASAVLMARLVINKSEEKEYINWIDRYLIRLVCLFMFKDLIHIHFIYQLKHVKLSKRTTI